MTHRIRIVLSAGLALLAAAALFAAAPKDAHAGTHYFAPTSVWNTPIPAASPIDPNSPGYVANLVRQAAPVVQGGYGSSISTTTYGVPIYTVGADQATVTVKLDSTISPLLSAAFQSVPLPPDAIPAAGTDGNLAVYQPATDTMWEFWRLSKQLDGWHARFGGKMTRVSEDPGAYRDVLGPDGKNFIERCHWGAPSSKVPLVAGVITVDEMRSGVIPHALLLSIPEVRAGVWTPPAQATDGKSTYPNAIPMGTRFRLDPSVNVDALNVPAAVKVFAHAAQTYGLILGNRSGGVGFRAEDPAQYGTNPWPTLFGGIQPSMLMRQFPWSKLQALPVSLRSTCWS